MPDTPKAASEAAKRLLESDALEPTWDRTEKRAEQEIARALASFHAAELRKLADTRLAMCPVGDSSLTWFQAQADFLRAEAARWEAM